MDRADLVGIGKAQQLGQLAGGEAARLELRSHRTVEEQEGIPCEHGGEAIVFHAKTAGHGELLPSLSLRV